MGGPGSGDRPHSKADLRRRALNKAWKRTEDILDDNQHPKRDEVSVQLALRDIPQESKQDIKSEVTISDADKAILDRYTQRSRVADSN